MFANREEAGDRLAQRLTEYKDDARVCVVALPRGGVPVGYRVSVALHVPLDVLITRKLGAPGNPELAMGAVAETGAVFLNREVIGILGVSQGALDREIDAQREEIRRRQARYRGGRPLTPLADRTVILVDDGIATGSTFFASIEALRGLSPARLVGAIPVGPLHTIEEVRRKVDAFVVLETPEPFFAVGEHYADFPQLEDDEVIRYLNRAAARNDGERAALRGGGF